MPDCCCYHEFTLEPDDSGGLVLTVEEEGFVALLRSALESVGLAEVAEYDSGFHWEPGRCFSRYNLSGVRDRTALEGCLALLRDRFIIDLAPELEQCYALGPYSFFTDDGNRFSAPYGKLVHGAKYRGDSAAVTTRSVEVLSEELARFVRHHLRLRTVAVVTAPPKMNGAIRNIPLEWARSVAQELGAMPVEAQKTRSTGQQKNLQGLGDEQEVAEGVAGSMSVNGPVEGDVLIIDDVLGSGGTLRELARAFKNAGAQRVYGLCVAKDAKFTRGGIGLSKERWG